MASAALMVRVNTTYEAKGAFLIAMWLQKPMCVSGVYAARQLGGLRLMIAATMATITLKIIALLETLFACFELAKARRAIESVSSSRASRLVESLRSNSTCACTEYGAAFRNVSSLAPSASSFLSSMEPDGLSNRFSLSSATRLPRHSVMPCWPAAKRHTVAPHRHDPPTRSWRPSRVQDLEVGPRQAAELVAGGLGPGQRYRVDNSSSSAGQSGLSG
jgi:hypothetical protein